MGRPWSKGDSLLAADLDSAFDDVEAKAVSAQNIAITAQNTADAALPLAGGTMVGDLTLANDPTDDLHAATKHYVDNHSGGSFVPLSGGTMTGPLVLSADPSALLGAATKQYVDAASARSFIDVTKAPYSAKGDGVTDDSAALQAALNACASSGGGIVYAPPTGKSYFYRTGLQIPGGVKLMGAATKTLQGGNTSVAAWSAVGTWFQCVDTVNPAVSMGTVSVVAHGAVLSGINFIYSQPVPGATWTPTAYPWAVQVMSDHVTIEDVMVVGGTHGINLEAPNDFGIGAGIRLRNIYLSTYVRGLRTFKINDTITIETIFVEDQTYAAGFTYPAAVNFLLSNLVGWEIDYCDNPLVSNAYFFLCAYGMLCTDESILGNTHSLYNAQMVNVQTVLCRCGISVATNTTTATGVFTNWNAQSDGAATATLFNLPSNNVDISISNLTVPWAAARVIELGGGAGGRLSIDGLNVLDYSAIVSGQPCLQANAGSTITLGARHFHKTAGAGATLAGLGTFSAEAISVKDFGAKGDGVTDDFAAIQDTFTWTASTGNPIGPAAGIFTISAPLVLLPSLVADGTMKRPGPEINLGQRAYFKATSPMGTMLTIGSTASDFSGLVVGWTLKLGEWDCNGMANEGIAVAFANGCRIRDTRVRNHLQKGFHLGSQGSPTPSFEIYVEDCGTDRSLSAPAPVGSVGIYYDNSSDMAISNSVIVGNQIGVSANASGGNFGIWDAKLLNVHVWNYPESGELLYGIEAWGDNHLIGCQVDGPFQYAYRFHGPGNVITNSECNYGGTGSLSGHAYPLLLESGSGLSAIGNRWKCTNPATSLVAEATGDLLNFSSIENIVNNTNKFGPRSANSVNTWALINVGASPSVQGRSNVSSVTKNAVGDYTVSTNNSLDTAGAISVTPGNGGIFMVGVEVSNSRTANSVRVQFYDSSGSLIDPNTFSIMFVGRPTGIY